MLSHTLQTFEKVRGCGVKPHGFVFSSQDSPFFIFSYA